MRTLKIEDCSLSYGRIEALRKVNLHVEKGELIALIGGNGSGKTTLLKVIIGIERPNFGKIFFLDKDVTDWPVERIVASGVFLVPEGRGILPAMTVSENLELGGYHREDIREDLKAVFERFTILKERRNQPAGNLSGGEQQMLAIARALVANPKLLMLDEPSLGLAPIAVSNLFRIILDLKKEGYTILLAEQNAKKALKLADRGYVFEMGRIILEGDAEALRDNPAVRQAYMGVE